jgi:hypothetical protein
MEGTTKRRHLQWLLGCIVSAIGERKYLVQFDNRTEKKCSSAVLRVEEIAASLPPNMQIPIAFTHVEAMGVEDAQDEIADQDEEAELPEAPEVDEEEVVAEEQAGEGEAE